MNLIKIAAAVALSVTAITVGVKPASAATYCTGSEYFVTCTSNEYDYASGKYVSCYGSGTPGYITWSCNAF